MFFFPPVPTVLQSSEYCNIPDPILMCFVSTVSVTKLCEISAKITTFFDAHNVHDSVFEGRIGLVLPC